MERGGREIQLSSKEMAEWIIATHPTYKETAIKNHTFKGNLMAWENVYDLAVYAE